jgi:hypothetical protein
VLPGPDAALAGERAFRAWIAAYAIPLVEAEVKRVKIQQHLRAAGYIRTCL